MLPLLGSGRAKCGATLLACWGRVHHNRVADDVGARLSPAGVGGARRILAGDGVGVP